MAATAERFCGKFQTIYPAIRIHLEVRVEERDVPEPQKFALFRVIRDAFHNIAKHSKAKQVVRTLENTNKEITLT